MASYFEMYQQASNNQWRWRFVASNGKIIAMSSEAYHNKADCRHGIDLIKAEGPGAPVIE